jgi:phosphoglycolate phosphatase-like HAD superfamily hydrolase
VNLLVRLGRLDEARREFDRLDGQTGPILQDWSLWFRSDQVALEVLRLLGREDLARNRAREIVAEAAKQFARGNRSPLVLTDYIRSEIILGHGESALKALEEWRREAQREPSIQRRNQEFTSAASRLYALLGKVDEAVELLRELQANGHIGRYGLADNPEFTNLRSDPRFQEIVRQYEAWRKTLPDPVDL